jgi:hypothetical protein
MKSLILLLVLWSTSAIADTLSPAELARRFADAKRLYTERVRVEAELKELNGNGVVKAAVFPPAPVTLENNQELSTKETQFKTLSTSYKDSLFMIKISTARADIDSLISELEKDSELVKQEDSILWWKNHWSIQQYEGDNSAETAAKIAALDKELGELEQIRKINNQTLEDLKAIHKIPLTALTHPPLTPEQQIERELVKSNTIFHKK